MAHSTQSLLVTMPSSIQILKEHREINLTEVERLTKQLEDKEVELVERVKEADRYSQKKANLQACLQRANDLLLQQDWELEAERHRAERVACEKEKKEVKVLCEEIERLEDIAYVCYEQGFDEAFAQVKHFTNESAVDLSKVNQERKHVEILAKEARTNCNVQEVAVDANIQFRVKEEEEERGNPHLLFWSILSFVFCIIYIYIYLIT